MLVIGICLVVLALPFSLELKCLPHLLASHRALAAEIPSEICLVIFEAELYGRSVTLSPVALRTTFVWQSASSSQGY